MSSDAVHTNAQRESLSMRRVVTDVLKELEEERIAWLQTFFAPKGSMYLHSSYLGLKGVPI